MGIESSVGFECFGTRSARIFALRFVNATYMVGQRSFADKCSVARRTVKVSLLLVHRKHVIAFATAIGKGFGAQVAGEWSAYCSRCWRKVVVWFGVYDGCGIERFGVFNGESVSGHVDDQFEPVDIFIAHVAMEDLVAVVVAQVLNETLLGVQSLFAESADVLVAQSSTAGVSVGFADWRW